MGPYHFFILLIFCVWSYSNAFFAGDVPNLLSSRYGSQDRIKQLRYGGGVKGRVKGGRRKGGTKNPVDLFGKQTAAGAFEGGCIKPPEEPPNGKLRCSFYSGCSLSCKRGYALPGGVYAIYIMCENGKWISQDTKTEQLPSCQPTCNPPCQNQGICIEPDQCKCSDQFSGPQCQFENKACLELPPLPQKARRTCRKTQDYCTVNCLPGHEFPDGSEVATLTCKNGQWVPGRNDWISIPDCQATCNPPCQNGGQCLSLNVCQCPQDFRGPQCQYNVSACSLSKLNFNGGIKCSGDSEKFVCTDLSCGEGMKLSHEAAPAYTCKYSEGTFYPTDVPSCDSDVSNITAVSFSSVVVPGINANHEEEETSVVIENNLPRSGVCYSWAGVHYKTFDERLYSFDSECTYTLVKDSVDNTFSITIQNAESCYRNDSVCSRNINIYVQGRSYKLNVTESGHVMLTQNGLILPVPGQAVGIRTESTVQYINVLLDSVGIALKWDRKTFLRIDAKESLWNRTEGLCGNLDGDPANDIVTKNGFQTKTVVSAVSSWQVDEVGVRCKSTAIEKNACPKDGVKGSLNTEAHAFCTKLLTDERFSSCKNIMNQILLMKACTWDYCNCNVESKSDCACTTMSVYVAECKNRGLTNITNWRTPDTCPLKCSGGKIYKSCGPAKGQPTCGSSQTIVAVDPETCEEGCFCPEGKVLHNDECIPVSECPCRLRKKEFPAGSSVPKDCNTCTCQNGHWVCTQVTCGARCSAVGDPHYTTFDGKKYDFMGQCSYYLLQANNFSIQTENVACPGAISELMSFAKTTSSEMPSCTKTATIRINSSLTIKLGQNHDVFMNGVEVPKLPLETSGIVVRIISSIFLQVILPNKIEIWWDGVSRIYIDVPASFRDQTKGLCGTFNRNQKDDFLTPEGDVEQSVISFANKWKTSEACENVPNKVPTHPCEVNMHRKANAEELCSKIKSDIFAGCHFYVNPDQYYQDCLYDVCSCQGDLKKCLCTIISSYAHECASKGVKVDWRGDVKECALQCPPGQQYQSCGNPCSRSCYDISTRTDCTQQCVEGCNCPVGEALDENGECIPVTQCKCYSNGLVFNPGYKEIRRIENKPDVCTCAKGGWSCTQASDEDIKLYPDAADLKTMCNATLHMEFTSCEPAEPKTCKNMDTYDQSSPAICQAGCMCKEGYVLDTVTKECIKPSDCPCHHGAKSYKENEIVQNDCNTCTCKGGKWSCTDRLCAAECSAWGDSHYKTFDGRHYDYQGQCDYVLAKGSLGDSAAFDISIQNVPCGSLGTSCSKSITIRVNVKNETETISLNKGKHLPSALNLHQLTVREIGLYVIIESPDLGVSVRWDRGTRVYVRLSPKWKNEVKGLCGNYNDNELDDFQTPSGGVTEVSPDAFGDSWKLEPYCPEAKDITDTCSLKPERRIWAMKKCGILKTSLFMPCHSEVPIDNFYDKCLFDTCGCDQGGDCECLCTALAAYAQECNNRGVPIHWRSQELCPIQCNEKCSAYSPCISTCLVETCDNIYTRGKISATCREDTCVEGCEIKPCPAGQVYFNSTFDRCVPVADCKPVCMQINGVTYYEGDVLEEDSCHTCYCSRGVKNCKGQPCTEVPQVITTSFPITVAPEDQGIECVGGWTDWINQNPMKKGKTRSKEVEPLPSSLEFFNEKAADKNETVHQKGRCSKDRMKDIRCRTVGTKISAKETGLDAECSLERGLVCKSARKGAGCPDFEIKVFCHCGEETSTERHETTATSIMEITELPGCDSLPPKKPDEGDCHKYYVCDNGPKGPEYVEQTCGNVMMFNPKILSCDKVDTVASVRPECAISTTEQVTITESYNVIITGKPECNSETPNKPKDGDCHKYFACNNGPDGAEYIEQTCGGSMMFNTQNLRCDDVEIVSKLRPECESTTTTQATTTTKRPTTAGTTEISYIIITGKPQCNSETPNKPHQSDCRKFFVCENGPDGAQYVEETCSGNMMYNTKTFSCDRIDVVTAIRPECEIPTTSTKATTRKETTQAVTTTTESSFISIVVTGKPECSSETPPKPHDSDCHKYLSCNNGANGAEYIEQTCGRSMMFNPETLKCDSVEAVSNIKPECAESTTTEPTTTTKRQTTAATTEISYIIITGKPQCNSETPNKPHQTDCSKFYVCENGPDGAQYVEETCSGPMMYNPKTLSCDRVDIVTALRPECKVPTTEAATTSIPSTTSTSFISIVVTGKPECSSETPNKPHDSDCHKYLLCNNGPNGAEYIEQTCGETMMFNTETLRCDTAVVVTGIRTECAKPTTSTTTTRPTTQSTTSISYVIITGKPQCNSETPNKPHQTDCSKFYVCENGPDGAQYVEETCAGPMMYNPKTLSCDRAEIVTALRPECETTTTSTERESTSEATTSAFISIVVTGKPECNMETLNKAHDSDCHKYFACNNGPNGAEYIEQTCGPTMMFNPITLKCDTVQEVSNIKPECAETTSTEATTTSKRPTTEGTTEISYVILTGKPECNSETPNKPHSTDCHKFYVCQNGPAGAQYVEQSCSGLMMYNTETFSCDRVDIVTAMRPECEVPTTSTQATTTTTGRQTTPTTSSYISIVVTGKPECGSETPNKPQDHDCRKYFACNNGPNGAEYIEQTCGPSMMFNPVTLTCDSVETVSNIKPECAESTSTEATTTTKRPTTSGTTTVSYIIITGKPQCNSETPNKPHQTDCSKFYVCENGPDGAQYVEETCAGPMLFNPETLRCDRVDIVTAIRPECEAPTTTQKETTSAATTSTSFISIVVTGKPECSSETPNKPDDSDCHKYFVCNNGPNGAEYVQQTCGPAMMFNPDTLKCDSIDTVSNIKPECAESTTSTESTTTTTRRQTTAGTTEISYIIITGKPECNSETPNKPHQTDCRKFYICENGPDGAQYVEESCSGPMMYNTKTFSCDRDEVVTAMRPECVGTTTEVTTTRREITPPPTTSTSFISIVVTTKPQCGSETPNKPDDSDCHKYFVCDNGPDGAEYLEHTCGPTMMFNPVTLKCDTIDAVSHIRPECGSTTTEASTTTRRRTTSGTTEISYIIITGKPQCNGEMPNKPHQTDCHKFYVCENGPDGAQYVEESCSGPMMYNPKTFSCDRADIVTALRPECGEATTLVQSPPTTTAVPTTSTSVINIIVTGKPECSMETPNKPHETDCHKYFACNNGPNGAEYIEQTCGGNMMFNTETLQCDTAESVSTVRPECAVSTTTTTSQPTTTRSTSTGTTSISYIIITGKPQCNSETPNKPHQTDCNKFYVCENGEDGAQYVEESCSGNLLYNTKTFSCDRSDIVSAIRPECAQSTTPTEKTTTLVVPTTTQKVCNADTPNKPHEKDCNKFYVCHNGPNGPEYVEQTCQGQMMYNPNTLSCDRSAIVSAIRPECDNRCPPGLKYHECAINCQDLCMSYDQALKSQGLCKSSVCEPGCVEPSTYDIITNNKCTGANRWANNTTCVNIQDCMCVSNDGKPVKPGSVYKESNCKVCQCVQNFYICDESHCTRRPTQPTTEKVTTEATQPSSQSTTQKKTTPFVIVVNTATPPPPCDLDFISLIPINLLQDTFNASSSKNSKTQPKEANPTNKAGSWSPSPTDKNPSLVINLQKVQPVYGIQVAGNPKKDEFVTSYNVLHSNDGNIFLPFVGTDLLPQTFRGPRDHLSPAFQKFTSPVDTKYVKVVPLTWHKNISMRVDVIGCGQESTTVSTTESIPQTTKISTTVSPPVCTDKMGPATHPLSDDQITVSSSKDLTHDKQAVSLLKPSSWQPAENSPNEWIEFNFLEPRNLTGVQTKGDKDSWVEAFTVKYSNDGTTWNPISDDNSNEIVFPANHDTVSTATSYFPSLVNAKYLRLYPVKWHNSIQLKAEIIGCYNPIPSTSTTESTTTEKLITSASTKVTAGTTPRTQSTTTEAAIKSTPFVIVVNTATPPPPCDLSFISLIPTYNIPDDMFNASSFKNSKTRPEQAKPTNKVGSWSPSPSDNAPFLVINLQKDEPVYGIQIMGNPKKNEYVTTYNVYHSSDGNIYSPFVGTDLLPQKFRGPFEHLTPAFQKFVAPVEAKYIKIVPLTWHKNISMRVDIIGCGQQTTTVSTTLFHETTQASTTQRPPICTDKMGPSNQRLSNQQITVSSTKDLPHDKTGIDMEKPSSWQPLVDSPTEWVEFNFVEPRNLTGFETKGGEDGWVEAFTVKYSKDGKKWNPILDKNSREIVFPGNYDSVSKETNYFPLPVQAKALRLYPVKWHNTIQLKAEIIGCYKPIPTTPSTVATTPTTKTSTPITEVITPSTEATSTEEINIHITNEIHPRIQTFTEMFTLSPCNVCPGSPSSKLELGSCQCGTDRWWNGTGCVERPLCPCIVGSLRYPVGQLFNKEDCSECVCKIGGIVDCTEKICGGCRKGLKSVVTSTCECDCETCPPGQRLCQTTNMCIDSSLWCNGVIDCHDDELNCEVTTTTTARPSEDEKVCPDIICPPNFRKVPVRPGLSRYRSSRFSGIKGRRGGAKGVKGIRGVKGGVKGRLYSGVKGGVKAPYRLAQPQTRTNECVQYKCISTKIPPPFTNSSKECEEEECPPGYEKADEVMVDVGDKQCPALVCAPMLKPDSICNAIGRTFTTFDGTEYKYDICDHVLVRSLNNGDWSISLSKNCTDVCSRDLHIHIGEDHFIFHPDLSVEYNGYNYKMNQLKRIGKQTNEFSISKIGNVIGFNALTKGFWIEWNTDGDVKVGVVHSLTNKIDGMCGFYDDQKSNDKQKPNGELAKTTKEFGDSWSTTNDNRPECKVNKCPADVQNKAWQLCNSVRDEYLSPCSKAINIDASVSRCLDSACDCIVSSTKENVTNVDKCKCDLLQSFVVECLTANPDIDVSGWRGQYDCPSNCPAPLIHKDCFQRECEPSCESLSNPMMCPKVDHACYPGCYCPDEMVRKGDQCIKPPDCRDCECKTTGKLDVLTYDETNFTMAGNCVYVLTRDMLSDKQNEHSFEVLLTNGPCEKYENRSCIKKVTTLYKGHEIVVLKDADSNTLQILIDSQKLDVNEIDQIPDWVKIKVNPSNELNILLPSDQVEVNVKYPSLGVTVRVPSYKYGKKLEGLCGDCDRNPDDDLHMPNGTVTDNVEEFSLSWLYDGLPEKQDREQCRFNPKEKCKPIPENANPCIHLMDETVFGACHPVVDPTIYQTWCNQETCTPDGEIEADAICAIIETYAKECTKEGICVNWHFDMCPQPNCTSDKVFSACGSTCTKTCETLDQKEVTCVPEIVEGCFCPEGKVLKGDICIPERECIDCDGEGHHPGDEWVKDICTNCTCEGRNVMCQKKQCPAIDTICEQGYNPVKILTNVEECCDKYTCVPVTTTTTLPTCTTPQPVVCGENKRPRLSKKDDGCYQNICECIPKDQCPPVDLTTPQPLENGYMRIVDESDCCAKINLICKPELCAAPPVCSQFYEVKTQKDVDQCCPTFTCVPPADKCIVENSYVAAKKGGERLRKPEEKQKMLRQLGETWSDGPCRDCQCQADAQGVPQTICTEKQCPTLEKSADYNDYDLKAVLVYNQCCAKFVRSACKVNGQIHNVGDEWIEGDDYCSVNKCASNTEGDIIKEVHVTKCVTDCQLGYEYIPATRESQKCCGICEPVACVINDTVRRNGEEWSSADFCTQYKCSINNNTMQVEAKQITCGKISPETLKNYVINSTKVEGECCEKLEVVACKVNDDIYQVDDTWTSKEDACKNFKCSKLDDSRLAIVEYLTTCNTTCPDGYTYSKDESSSECCGVCKQSACVVDGQIRAIGEVWSSPDYCTISSCMNLNGTLQVEKSVIRCNEIPAATLENYVVETEKVPGKCCNHSVVVACRGNGKVYEAGESWTVGTDYCSTYMCTKVGQELAIGISVTTCNTTCPDGFEYIEPSDDEEKCCGKCKQSACVVNGTIRHIDEQWMSADYCHKYRCVNSNGILQIAGSNIMCRDIPEETLKNYVVESTHVPGRCCNLSKVVACRGNNQIQNVGDTWFVGNDYCHKFECAQINEQLAIREYVTQCNTTCPAGFEYVPASIDEQKCCGSCEQSQCVVNGTLWEIGQTWDSDDHCAKYKCSNISGVIQVETQNIVCQSPTEEVQREFVVEQNHVDGQCCPMYRQVACRGGNMTYEIGETWSTGDLCKNITCTRNDQGQIIKRESIETCKEQCDEGFKYVPSQDSCCGTCVGVACVINGDLKQPGDIWTSADGCTNFTCEKDNDHMVVSAHTKQCPNLSDCPPEHVYDDGCCKACNMTTENQVRCAIESLPLGATINTIKTENIMHGVCVNKEPIANLTQCVGTCESSTLFDSMLGEHTSICTCCQAVEYMKIAVPMVCDDGFRWNKHIDVPSVCSCNGCQAGLSRLMSAPTKAGRKTNRKTVKTRNRSSLITDP